jgi:transposase
MKRAARRPERLRRLSRSRTPSTCPDSTALSVAKTPSGGQAVDLSALIRRQSPSYDQHPAPNQVASYVGLTPRVRASAGHIRTGPISKEGNRLLRWVLVLAATQAVRRPGPLRRGSTP